MGQPVTGVEERSTQPDVIRFRINRSLTGMNHERYLAGEEIVGDRPVDELGRRVLAHQGVQSVHVHSNVITVDLADSSEAEGIEATIEDLFTYYREGVTPDPVP